MVKVYYSLQEARLSETKFSAYLKLLPSSMSAGIRRFKRWEDAQASLIGKMLLKHALHEMRIANELSDLKYSAYGRPYLENCLDFNISHAYNLIACTFSTQGKIGIDVEKIRDVEISDFQNIFHEQEWAVLMAETKPAERFFKFWTAKEAIVKADGSGLNAAVNHLLINGGSVCLNDTVWFYREISLCKGYIAHIASDIPSEEISISAVAF